MREIFESSTKEELEAFKKTLGEATTKSNCFKDFVAELRDG